MATTITAWEEALILELRRSLGLALDDILEAMRRCVNPKLSRSGFHRCLKRHALSARLTPEKAPALAFETDRPAGFIHIDVKHLPPLHRQRTFAFVAIDRAPPASSTSKSSPIAAEKPPPASSTASSPASP